MSRTSLGQKHELKQREQVGSLKQMQSIRRTNNYQQQLFQTHVNLYDEVQYFLHMKERYLKVEKQHKFMDFQRDYGESYNNIKDGYGIHIFINGDRFIGFWEKNTMHGMGIYIFKSIEDFNRVAYLGEFYNGKFHGIGKLVRMQNQINGEIIYKGTWFQGKKSQNGIYFYENPSVFYQGGWMQDQRSGEGKLTFPNGQFVGQWEGNMRNGYGKLKKIQNNLTVIYEGQWKNDQLSDGQITYFDLNGLQIAKYRGQISQGKKHGQGLYKMKSIVYEGTFENDCIKGQGIIKTNTFNITGFFQSNHGVIQNSDNMKALITYDNKDSFEGYISIINGNVLRQKGIYKFSNGDIAEGHFNDNAQGNLGGSFLYRYRNGQQRNY